MPVSFTAIALENNVTVGAGGKMYTANSEHPLFKRIVKKVTECTTDPTKVTEKDLSELLVLFDATKSLTLVHNDFSWDETGVKYKGEVIGNALTKRILQRFSEGEDTTPYIKLLEKLIKNPSMRARNDLPKWIEASNLPIAEDGDILAFKKVRADFTDCHTGKIDHSVGKEVSQPREECDDDFRNTCSHGLHFANRRYLDQFKGPVIILVKINPRDIVAFPTDYGYSKARGCRYVVVKDITKTYDNPFQTNDVSFKKELTTPVDQLVFDGAAPGVKYTSEQVLESLDNVESKAEAARNLGIHPRTLGRWLDKIAASKMAAMKPVVDEY